MSSLLLRLGRGVRLQFETSTRSHVLLFPEGCVDLNESAASLLSLLPSTRSGLKRTLRERHGPRGEEGVDDFLDQALSSKWIR